MATKELKSLEFYLNNKETPVKNLSLEDVAKNFINREVRERIESVRLRDYNGEFPLHGGVHVGLPDIVETFKTDAFVEECEKSLLLLGFQCRLGFDASGKHKTLFVYW